MLYVTDNETCISFRIACVGVHRRPALLLLLLLLLLPLLLLLLLLLWT